MTEHHLSPSRLFAAGFLLFLVVFGVLVGVFGPLFARFLGQAQVARALLVVGLTGTVGGLAFGVLFAGMAGRKPFASRHAIRASCNSCTNPWPSKDTRCSHNRRQGRPIALWKPPISMLFQPRPMTYLRACTDT
jgi:hypothetical protein